MNNLIETTTNGIETIADMGRVADQVARSTVFADYRLDLAPNTIRRQDNDLKLFSDCIREIGQEMGLEDCEPDFTDPATWECVTFGLVKAFVNWQLGKGYSVGSVNVRLSTIKRYSGLAFEAGTIKEEQYLLIKNISTKDQKQARNIDQKRRERGLNTRYERPGAKKSEHTTITLEQAQKLKKQPSTDQGKRDRLLMCLLLDHGLRASEVAGLTLNSINLADETITFYRPKTDQTTTQKLSKDTLKAATSYLALDRPATDNKLLNGSRKGGALTSKGMIERVITRRVRTLAQQINLAGASAHDCRHHCATKLAKKMSLPELMDVFGWKSPQMAIRYIEAAKVVVVEK